MHHITTQQLAEVHCTDLPLYLPLFVKRKVCAEGGARLEVALRCSEALLLEGTAA
jgi:hypothetical protein